MDVTYDELIQNIEHWHAATPHEALAEAEERKQNKKFVGTTGSHFDVSAELTPVDIYCILKSKFGEPNGIQMLFKKKNDVDNLIHWAWELKYKNTYIHITGFFFHFSVLIKGSKDPKNDDQQKFLKAFLTLKKKVKPEIETVKSTLEKWLIFSNPYVQFSDMVEEIIDELEAEPKLKRIENRPARFTSSFQEDVTENSKHFADTFRRRITLKLIIPIWIESFINLIIFLCAKPSIRETEELTNFKISPWRNRLKNIHSMCMHVSKVDMSSEKIKQIEPLFKNRNRLLHGGIAPTITGKQMYFAQGHIPLLDENLYMTDFFHDISLHGLDVDELYNEVELARNFIAFMLELIEPKFVRMMLPILNDSTPGWDEKRKVAGQVIPKHIVDMFPVFDPISTEKEKS